MRVEAVLQHQLGGRRSWDPRLDVLGASKEALLYWLGREEFSLLGAEGLRSSPDGKRASFVCVSRENALGVRSK